VAPEQEPSTSPPTGVADYVATLEPRVLLHDTRVTNHGFSGGRAVPLQSVLQAGTAVLVDAVGVPLTRCACGNPLAPPGASGSEVMSGPSWPGEQTPDVVLPGAVGPVPALPLDGTVADAPSSDDFCTVWAAVEPTVAGGPSGPDDLEAYIARAQVGFTRLVEAAERTDGFPADALADLKQYRDDLLAWSGTGSPGSTELRDRIEAFLPTWCDGEPAPESGAAHGDPVVAPDDPSAGPGCGSMRFYLLVYAAEGLGVEHAAVSQPYVDALEAVLAGIDPGGQFDIADLMPALAYDEIGCEGAQAMYDLLVDSGFGDVLTGTDLEP